MKTRELVTLASILTTASIIASVHSRRSGRHENGDRRLTHRRRSERGAATENMLGGG